MSQSRHQSGRRIWVEVPTWRIDQFRMALLKLSRQSPNKTTSQIIEDAVLAQAESLSLILDLPADTPLVLSTEDDDRRVLRMVDRCEFPTARDIYARTRRLSRDQIHESLMRLAQQGIIEMVATSRSVRYRLTEQGRQEVL